MQWSRWTICPSRERSPQRSRSRIGSSPLPRLIGCITAKPDPLERAAARLPLRLELACMAEPPNPSEFLNWSDQPSVVRLCCGRDGPSKTTWHCLSNAKNTSTALINRAVPGALRSGGIDASLEPIQGLPAGSDERRSLLPLERPRSRKGRQGMKHHEVVIDFGRRGIVELFRPLIHRKKPPVER